MKIPSPDVFVGKCLMRILLIHNSADLYGASRSLVRLCGQLNRAEFEPLVLLPESGPLVPLLHQTQTEVLVFPALRVITRPVLKSWHLVPWLLGFMPSAWRLSRILREQKIALVHTNTGVICSGALAAKFAGIPHVWHIRDWFQEFGPLWKPYSLYILALSNHVLCVSKPIAAQFPPNSKIEVLNNGFDLAEFAPVSEEEKLAARQQFGIRNDDFVAATVGRIKFIRKGQEFLLEAAKTLQERGKSLTCLFAGGPAPGAEDQFDRMKALADQLGVRAIFTGELSDARAAYAACDVFVLPSAQPEPFGGVVMEAMALGRPVIGTAIGGTCEQIADGETGILVPPANSPAIANALEALMKNESLRNKMGAAGRQRIAERFTLDGMVSRITDVYRDLLPEAGTKRRN